MMEHLPFWLWPLHRQVLSILIFHRVLAGSDPLRPGEITAADFEDRMRLIGRHCAVLPLVEAVERLQGGTLPRRACCITFDDGYADNLSVALPILQRYKLPFTVFVATAYLDGGRMFNDTVIEIIARASGKQIDLGRLGLGRFVIETLEDRLKTIDVLQKRLKYMPPHARDELIVAIADELGCDDLPNDLMLTSEQIRELDRAGVEIGGHTAAHTILNTLTDEQAQAEIATGKRDLEKLTGRPLKVFAYPNGFPQRDMSQRHVNMVRELGFQAAVTTAHGIANRRTDIYQLPRFTPWDNSLPKFAARMTRNAWVPGPERVCE